MQEITSHLGRLLTIKNGKIYSTDLLWKLQQGVFWAPQDGKIVIKSTSNRSEFIHFYSDRQDSCSSLSTYYNGIDL